MKTILLVLMISGLNTIFFSFDRKKCPDLKVVEIQQPEYDGDIKGSIVKVTVTNAGNQVSDKCDAHLYDIDISYEEGVRLGYDTLILDLLAENNARGSYYSQGSNPNPNADSLDYDLFVEDFVEVPPLVPGDTVVLVFQIEDYWIYDSNCEIEVELDANNTLKECNEKNNKERFFGWG